MASCGSVSLRTERGENIDVRVIAPCDSKSRVVKAGKAPNSGRYSIAGDLQSGSCSIYGAGGSGNGYVVSKTITRDSGTPYVVSTITTIG